MVPEAVKLESICEYEEVKLTCLLHLAYQNGGSHLARIARRKVGIGLRSFDGVVEMRS